MKFLFPIAGSDDGRYGTLVSPSHYAVPAAIKNGGLWACDNDAYSIGYQPQRLLDFLSKLLPYRKKCLFVVVPDSIGNAVETLDRYRLWAWKIKQMGYPVALAGQDGVEGLSWPPEFDCFFVGGSTEWKLSDQAKWCIKKAQKMGKHIHISRVNYWKRYSHFRLMPRSEEFTCDGTRTRYEKDKAVTQWLFYQKQLPLFMIA